MNRSWSVMSAALVVSTLLASAGLVMLLVAAMTGGIDIDSWRDRLLVTLTVVSAAAALGVVRKRRANRARLKLDPSGSSSAMVTRTGRLNAAIWALADLEGVARPLLDSTMLLDAGSHGVRLARLRGGQICEWPWERVEAIEADPAQTAGITIRVRAAERSIDIRFSLLGESGLYGTPQSTNERTAFAARLNSLKDQSRGETAEGLGSS